MTLRPIFWLFIIAIGVSCLNACKDDTLDPEPTDGENEIKYTLNGSVFNNKFVSYNDFLESATTVGYIDSINATEIKAVAQFNNSPVSFWLRFPGKNTGSFTYNEPTFPVTEYPADNKYFELTFSNDTILGGLAIKQINLNIAQYDTVGGRIKGTFNGSIYDYTSGNELLVTVSNGQFNLIRQY